MRCIMIGDTRRNTYYPDKPNEDFFWFNEAQGAALILDGVTRDRENGIYPNPSPARIATEAFAQGACTELVIPSEKTPREQLLAAVEAGNTAVACTNKGFSSDFLPGTVGVLALVRNNMLHYAYVGDSNGIVLSRNGSTAFTTPQTKAVHNHQKEFTAHEIRTHICNNAKHPCGYGVWTGESGAMDFLCIGTAFLELGDRVLLCTDGINAFLSAIGLESLYTMDSRTILKEAMAFRESEVGMDDRTVIIIDLE